MGIIGVDHDVVTVQLGDESNVHVIQEYTINLGLTTQPDTMRLRLGIASDLAGALRKYRSGVRYRIAIDGVVQMWGKIDDVEAAWGPSGRSLELTGRSMMAPLQDGCVDEEKSYDDASFPDFVGEQLDKTVGAHELIYSNDTNRKILAATPTTTGQKANTPPKKKRTIEAKIGARRYAGLLKPETDRAGLFLFHAAAANVDTPVFVLDTANTRQSVAYEIVNRLNQLGSPVMSGSLRFGTVNRYSQTDIHFRTGAGKAARFQSFGSVEDQEMKDLGFDKRFVHKDERCKSIAQAQALALKHQSDMRREGFALSYPVAGHTVLTAGTRRILAFDTMARITDEEFGVNGTFYIERVTHSGTLESKMTTIELERPEDMIFADPVEDE